MDGKLGRPPQWKIVLLTCRNPATDFRLPIARELHRLGHKVTYIWLKRNPRIVELGDPESIQEVNFLKFLRHMHQLTRSRLPIFVFNSTNLAFPMTSALLRLFYRGVWCFDIHDDLLYNASGLARMRRRFDQWFLLLNSDFAVHSARTIKELFPFSHHLGNASFLEEQERRCFDFSRVLVLSSIDMHFDFGFFETSVEMCPNLEFHLYGPVAKNIPGHELRLNELSHRNTNVFYHGPYTNAELPQILSAYAVNFAPLISNHKSTHYSDPLRYYHCLNSGIELVTTYIPEAQHLSRSLHIVSSPEEFCALMARLSSDEFARRNIDSSHRVHSWRERARRLIDILESET